MAIRAMESDCLPSSFYLCPKSHSRQAVLHLHLASQESNILQQATGHALVCSFCPKGRGICLSRHSPNIRASAAAWLIAHGNKITLPRLPTHIFILVFILFVKKNSTFTGILFFCRLQSPGFLYPYSILSIIASTSLPNFSDFSSASAKEEPFTP